MKAPQPLQMLTMRVNVLTRRRNVLSSLHLRHSAAHRDKRKESTMRGLTVRVTLAVLALVAALYLSTQRVGVAEAQTFNLEKAVTEAKTPADHEAIASYYEKEAATAKDKAAEHRRLAEIYRTQAASGRAPLQPMGMHCQQLAQIYESAAADNTALAAAHRQMAQEAAQKK
jgi:hypothetical protein